MKKSVFIAMVQANTAVQNLQAQMVQMVGINVRSVMVREANYRHLPVAFVSQDRVAHALFVWR